MAFLYTYFLLGLAAIAVPVILHLVQLRRAKKVMFSNVRFIQASQEVTSSQRKIKQLLILLCRILFIIFLVLAFAQPFIPGNVNSQASENDVSIVIDNSYSMQNLHAEKDLSLLDFATDKARSVLNLFPAGVIYNVAHNGSYSRNQYSSVAEVADNLNNLYFTASSSSNYSLSQQGHIFLFSDFQKNQFKTTKLREVPAEAQVHLIPIAAASSANIFVDTVYLEDAFVRSGTDILLHVELYNTANEIAEDVPLKLIINDRQVASLSLDLAPQQKSVATIKFKVDDANRHEAVVQVEDYPVEFDNNYYFNLTPSKGITITEVNAGDGVDLKNLYSKEPLFKFTRYNPNNVDYARVSDSDILILNGLKEIDAGLATTASNFVKEGGTVLVIPATAANSQGYDNFFRQTTIAARLATASTQTELLPPASDNIFFSGIFSDYDKKMQMPTAARVLQWNRASDDILKFRGGTSFLSRFERGKGQVYLMASPLNADQTSFVSHALLLPVLYKIAISGYKQEMPLAYSLSGGTVRMPLVQTTTGEGIYKLQKDSAVFIPEQQIRGGNLFFNIPPDLQEAGIYSLTLHDKPVSTLAFNFDNQESYLEQYTPEELRNLVGSDRKNIHVYDYGDAFSVKNEFEKRFFGVKLWKYCLILCLVFLMAEIALIRFL